VPDKDTLPCPTCGIQRRRDRTGHYIKKVKLSREYKKALTILSRDLNYLMTFSSTRPLSDEESTALRGYLKFIRDLMDKQDVTALEVPESELALESAKLSSPK
jgi:hypothetical protein